MSGKVHFKGEYRSTLCGAGGRFMSSVISSNSNRDSVTCKACLRLLKIEFDRAARHEGEVK
jgi:hypothetical protein